MKKNKLYTVNKWNQPAFKSAERNISELEDNIIDFSKKWIDEHPDQEEDKNLDIPQHKGIGIAIV